MLAQRWQISVENYQPECTTLQLLVLNSPADCGVSLLDSCRLRDGLVGRGLFFRQAGYLHAAPVQHLQRMRPAGFAARCEQVRT